MPTLAEIRAERRRREQERERERLARDVEAIRARCQTLAGFVREAWHVLEPIQPLVWNWHLDAICAHLEAVTDGRINRLLINVPPGSSKSLIVSVLWPAWEWGPKGLRSLRYLATAFNEIPVKRDTRKCRDLLLSEWYRALWPEVVLTRTAEMSFANSSTGAREGIPFGSLTSQRGDRLICFPAGEMVATEFGSMPIDEIVNRRLPIRVWSTNVQTGATSLKPVIGWVKNPASAIVEVELRDGASVRCTPDHRLWTQRGWVRADSLCASDVLPVAATLDERNRAAAHAKLRGEVSLRARGAEYLADLILGQLGPRSALSAPNVIRPAQALGEGAPCFAASDLLNSGAFDAELFREGVGNVIALNNHRSCITVDFRPWAHLVHRKGAVLLGVGNILFACAIDEVRKSAIGRAAIAVANLMTGRRRASKRQHHALVDEQDSGNTVATSVEARIPSLAGCPAFQNALGNLPDATIAHLSGPGLRSDAAQTADAVIPLVTRNRSPLFVRHIGHADHTYCLTVADNHTFYVGDGDRLLVANCDDPHSVKTAESDAERNETTRLFREGAVNRLNDQQRSAIVVVMQRLHEADLSGVIKKLGMEYVHLLLPMEFEVERKCRTSIGFEDPRTVEGELLDPGRFPRAEVEKLKRDMGSFAYAGQYQQRPAPRAGGMFKRAWFEGRTIGAAPKGTRWVRHWDLAATAKKTSARTAGVKIGKAPDGSFIVGHSVTTQSEGPEVRKLIKATAETDTRYVEISLPQDPGQAGKVQARDMVAMLAGFKAHAEPETGDKVTRAEPFAAQCEAGNVFIIEGAWNESYLDELCLFPGGAFKDQVDASSGAFARLTGTKGRMQISESLIAKMAQG